MRPERLVPVKWRLPECARTILPVAVNLKRLAAPRCVFSFFFGLVEFLGIAGISPTNWQACPPNRIHLHFTLLPDWGAAVLRPYKRTAKSVRPAARLAANLVLPREHPFWAPAARPKRCLPFAALFRSGRSRRFHAAGSSFSRCRLP